jgi:hypothetical protein
MTDEEMAKGYAITRTYPKFETSRIANFVLREVEGAYLAGLKKEKSNWHKQDIDDIYDVISKDWSIKHFICIMKDKSIIPAIGNCDEGCNGEVSVNLFFEYDDENTFVDDVVWWKEIELPKE